MAYLINLKTNVDSRGTLTVIEKVLPFEIKRVFYIYNVSDIRGEHRQKVTTQALVALNGSIKVNCDNGNGFTHHMLETPDQCLIVPPEDWHSMEFSPGAILLVLSSHLYDPSDIIRERY